MVAKAQPGKPVHGARHSAYHPPQARRKRRSRKPVIVGVTLAVLAAFGAWLISGPGGGKMTPEMELVAQMHLAADGASIPSAHALGGKLSVTRGERGLSVQVEGLDSKACVSVGWRLAPDGIVIVNGILPPRLSAAKLSELCAQGEDGLSTLNWIRRD